MRRQAFYNEGVIPDPIHDFDVNGTWDTTRYTNWQKILYGGVGRTIDAQASLSGGDARTTFRIGMGYNHTTGITTISGADQRASVSLSLGHKSLDQKLSISIASSFSFTQSDMINLAPAITLAPDAPSIYDTLGNLNFAGWGGKNGISQAEGAYPFSGLKQPYTSNTYFLNSHIIIEYEIIRGLQASVSFGYNVGQANQVSVTPIASQNPAYNPVGSLTLGDNHNINWIVEPQATYNVQLGKSKISILARGFLKSKITQMV